MTPIYLPTQAEVDAHNERAKVQREAFAAGIDESVFMSPEAIRDRAEKKYPFAQLRPQGFVGGSGLRYEWRHLDKTTLDPVLLHIPGADRAAASAALAGGVMVWVGAFLTVRERYKCSSIEAAREHEPEIITEAQGLLDREAK